MKENIDVMAGLVGMMGALLKSLKKKFSNREVIINMIVGGFLSFGVIAGIMMFLPKYTNDIRVIMFITFFLGWVSNDFTDGFEKTVSRLFDFAIDFLRTKTATKTTKKDSDEDN